MYTSEYNSAALPATASPSSHTNMWLNKDNYQLLDYELPVYNLIPNNIVGSSYAPQIVTTSSTIDSITPDPNWNQPHQDGGKWYATPKDLWFDQIQFRIYVTSGAHVRYLSDIKTFNCCAG